MSAHVGDLKGRPPSRAVLGALAVLLLALPSAGCIRTSPRFQEPFALANPNERFPILVREGEAVLDLAVYRNTDGLAPAQRARLNAFLADYRRQKADRLLIKAPSGGASEQATMRAMEDVRSALRQAGIPSRTVMLEPYYANGDPAAPLHLSYLRAVAQGPECPDWSENVGRDPQNMPYPNLGCATQANFAAMLDNPNDLVEPRIETPRSGERRDVVWGKYVNGQMTGSKWSPSDRPISERATTSDVTQSGN
jgi:pilus assembly protein CpaD